MNFKHSCFTENAPEDREWLEKLGYRRTASETGNIVIAVNGVYGCFELDGDIGSNFSDAIDCRSNSSLFKAVSAREDSDYMQYFIDEDGQWILCWRKDISIFTDFKKPHKATLSELIEKFK